MTARSIPLLAAALACFASPARAQDYPADPPPLPDPVTIVAEPVAPAEGWQGDWQGEWADDGTYHGTWSGTYSDPGPTATRAIYPESVPAGVASPGYPAVERLAWLNQCRNAYYPGGMTGAVLASGQPDVCEAYLQQYERSVAMAAQGGAYPQGVYAPAAYPPNAYAPGGYPPGANGYGYPAGAGGYGYPSGPVMWVRVPIIREPVAVGQ